MPRMFLLQKQTKYALHSASVLQSYLPVKNFFSEKSPVFYWALFRLFVT